MPRVDESILWDKDKKDGLLSRRLRVGVIGVGNMGRNHARIYAESLTTELIGVADTDARTASSVAQEFECQSYTNYRDLIKNKPDAISIATPTILHQEIALEAIKENINILVEKPIADTLANADGVIKAAQRRGVKLMVGHIERFNPAITKLKEIIGSGLLGDIISISAKRVGPYSPRIRDVGIILDLGTHDIDVITFLMGEKVTEIYALAGSVIHHYEDHAIITLKFSNGGKGVIETNWLTPHKVRELTVIGSEGIAEVNYIDSTLKILDKEWIRDAKIEKREPLSLEIEHFINCIRQDKEPMVSGKDGRYALELAIAAAESSKTGMVHKIA
jgi:UDP-N-acetylglucosamine 3-dehydrogenase